MITRKKIENDTISWHVILISVFFTAVLAGFVIFSYWYLFGENNIFKSLNKKKANSSTFVYPKHSLENVMKEKILNAGN